MNILKRALGTGTHAGIPHRFPALLSVGWGCDSPLHWWGASWFHFLAVFQALCKQRVNDSHIKWLQMCGKVWGERTASLLVFTQEPVAASRGSAEHI